MRICIRLAGLLIVAALSVAPARAGLLYFSYDGATSGPYSGYTASWTQPSDPTPYSFDISATVVAVGDVVVSVQGGPSQNFSLGLVTYLSGGDGGGFILVSPGGNTLINDAGDPFVGSKMIYTGTTAHPIFSPGVFLLTYGTLTAVPEPSTWAMMLIGFAGLGYAGYRKARTSRATLAA
jgi:hypothetical protein